MIDKIFLVKKPPDLKDFGGRLASIRKAKGLSQEELARQIGVSRRIVAYYEAESEHIPANLLIPIAKTLKVSLDELLSVKGLKDQFRPEHKSLMKKLRKIEELDPHDQKTIFRMVDSLSAQKSLFKNQTPVLKHTLKTPHPSIARSA